MDTNYSIYTSGLTRVFGTVPAVNNINLQIKEGEFYGFLGPNGAGKSTTIRMLCGLLRPTQGNIRISGSDIFKNPLEVKRNIGVLLEETNLYERLTAEEFLIFAAQMYGMSKDDAEYRTNDLLNLMELNQDRKKLIVDYSMGMKKKTALAAALIHNPKVIFLDEPFNGIDPVSVRAIRNVLRHLTENGATIFFSSHVMEVVERLCTRVGIINNGCLTAEGTIPELRANAAAGGNSTLEDVFMKLIDARIDNEILSWL